MLVGGTGLMGSWLASIAHNAGRTLVEKRGVAQPAAMRIQAGLATGPRSSS